MGSLQSFPPWISQPPSAFDIVTGFFPETKPKGELRLRPLLVLAVYRGKETGGFACQVAFGTKTLRIVQRRRLDIIVQNFEELQAIGLPIATRFDLDPENAAILPWTADHFGCWNGYKSPKIGALTEKYVKDYAYCMMLRKG